jgi:hypothetical protein
MCQHLSGMLNEEAQEGVFRRCQLDLPAFNPHDARSQIDFHLIGPEDGCF